MSDTEEIEYCRASGDCLSVKHPAKLDIKYVRKHIPHKQGKESANEKGIFLCFGHCNWYRNPNECTLDAFICIVCGYVQCWGCTEDFNGELEQLYPEWAGYGIANYCRNCGSHNSEVETIGNYWLMSQYLDLNQLKKRDLVCKSHNDAQFMLQCYGSNPCKLHNCTSILCNCPNFDYGDM